MSDLLDLGEYLERGSSRDWAIIAASAFGLASMVTAFLVLLLLAEGFDPVLFDLTPVLAPAAGVGGFIVGGILWWFVIEAGQRTTVSFGGLVGALTGILSHFAMWFFVILLAIAVAEDPLSLPIQFDSLTDAIFVLGSFSLTLAGLFTVPIGAFIGWQLMRLRRSSIEETSSEGNTVAESE